MQGCGRFHCQEESARELLAAESLSFNSLGRVGLTQWRWRHIHVQIIYIYIVIFIFIFIFMFISYTHTHVYVHMSSR